MREPDWKQAACTGKNFHHEWWFPSRGKSHGAETALAKHICHDYCPIQKACYAFGEAGSYVGVWGGVLLGQGPVLTKRPRRQTV